MKIAYLGYDALYPCLLALEAAGCTVMEVFTCDTDNLYEFNGKVTGFAEQRKIPCHVRRITLADIHRLKEAGCQAIFCAGYFYKVPIDHSLPIVNVHPSLLPTGRGAWPMPVVILRGLTQSGVTLHKMENDLDAGDILIQQAFPVTPQDNLETLTETICEIAAELCIRIAHQFAYYWNNAVPQGEYEYWDYPQKNDYTITSSTQPEEAERILRAFYGFDCYLQLDETDEICVVKGEFFPVQHSMPFGSSIVAEPGRRGYAITGGMVLEPIAEREYL